MGILNYNSLAPKSSKLRDIQIILKNSKSDSTKWQLDYEKKTHTEYESKIFLKENNKEFEILNENKVNTDDNTKKDNNSHECGLRDADNTVLCACEEIENKHRGFN